MKYGFYFILSLTLMLVSCDPDPAGPESDCTLMSPYLVANNETNETHVYNISSLPPTEIKNGTLEYDLFYQEFSLFHQNLYPYPYNEYWISAITFNNDQTAAIHYRNNTPIVYEYSKDDCQVEFTSGDKLVKGELVNGGSEIEVRRYAIYDHQLLGMHNDTFLFLEFRNHEFKTLETVITEFAQDNPGLYDTVAIELVINTSKK